MCVHHLHSAFFRSPVTAFADTIHWLFLREGRQSVLVILLTRGGAGHSDGQKGSKILRRFLVDIQHHSRDMLLLFDRWWSSRSCSTVSHRGLAPYGAVNWRYPGDMPRKKITEIVFFKKVHFGLTSIFFVHKYALIIPYLVIIITQGSKSMWIVAS